MKLGKNRKTLIRVAISAFLLCFGLLFTYFWGNYIALTAFIPAYLIVGYDVIFKAFRNIKNGMLLDENFLMLIASIGAFIIGESAEGVAVLLLYQVGEVFQRYAVSKSRTSISSLMEIRPDCAYLYNGGEGIKVEPDEVPLGSEIIIHPGERIPLDGVVTFGDGYLDASALTGESNPIAVKRGDEVLSGAINLSSVIRVKTTTDFYNSTVSRVLELAENAASRKAKAENFISKFAKFYTPIVVILAVLVAVIPSLFTGEWLKYSYSALTFLVVSCPCAIVISVPLAFFCGIGAASRLGVLIKGSNYVEVLAKTRVFVLDKTGTVTTGKFEVTDIYPPENREFILSRALIGESRSSHPVARAISALGNAENPDCKITEISGTGIKAEYNGNTVLCGNSSLMMEYNIDFTPCKSHGSVVYVSENNKFLGYIVVSDKIKDCSQNAVSAMKKNGGRVVMLSGDNAVNVENTAQKTGINEYYGSLLPADKVQKLEEILAKNSKGSVAFVGDGINDAPSLSLADIGIAMGGIGSDSAIEAADAVLMYDDLNAIVKARKSCRKTVKIVKQNVIFSLAVKIAIMILAFLGFGNMWLAVLGDVGVAVIAILNSLRAGKIEKNSKKA